MPDFSVIIITHDTLTALGIKHILYKYFTITPTVCDYLQPAETDNYDLYVTTSDIYVCNLDFFMPRRLKTVIIGEIKSQKPDTMIINRFDDKAMIIEAFNKFINKVEKNTSNTHNELSLREIDVLKLIAGGCLNKEIADRLNISINTVLTHRKNITAKLGIRSVSGLSFYAMMNGYVNSI
jgi:transcriptional regulator